MLHSNFQLELVVPFLACKLHLHKPCNRVRVVCRCGDAQIRPTLGVLYSAHVTSSVTMLMELTPNQHVAWRVSEQYHVHAPLVVLVP